MVGKNIDNVGNGNLKNNVHTAFQVKSKTDLCLQALLVRIDAQILHRVLVVLLFDWILYLSCLTVIVVCCY